MRNSRILALARKELKHILRDPRSLWIVFMLPNVMMFLFGYAIDLDLKNVRLAVCDLSRSQESRALVEAIDESPYFSVVTRYSNPAHTDALFESRSARAAVVIPEGFTRELARGRTARIGLLIDGSDANSAAIVQNYLETFIATHSLGAGGGASGASRARGGARASTGTGSAPISIRSTVLYNRALDSTNFIVPGIAAIVMMLLGALLTSVTIVREKETGTMEQILVSPVRPFEVVAGKVLPYLVLAVCVAAMIATVGHFWFRVPFIGSRLGLAFYGVLYLFTALSLGLLVSTLVSTQQVAMMLSLMLTLLPTIMLSGFIFPVASIPRALQFISYALPATHFLIIIRGVMLKGAGTAELWPHLLALGAIGLILMSLAVKRFSVKLTTKGAAS